MPACLPPAACRWRELAGILGDVLLPAPPRPTCPAMLLPQAYQVLRRGGVKDDRIIVMVADDVRAAGGGG